MDFDEYLSHNEELYTSPSDPYWLPFEASTEIGPQIDLGAMALDYYSSKTLSSSDYSCDPWSYPHVTSASFFDLMPLISATPPLTVSLSQLVDPLGNGDQDECITISPPSLLSFLVSDPHPCTETPAVPPGGQSPLPKVSKNRTHKPEYALPSDMLLDSPFAETSSDDEYHDSASDVSSPGPTTPQHIHYALSSQTVTVQRGPGEPGKINGHPIVRYSDGSYRCMSIVTASGKVSQYTRKRERAPHIGQPCSQTFRGRDEIGRHLKASRWHKKLDEECKPLTCDVCGQRLSRKDALGRHIRALHPKQKEKVPKSTITHSKGRASNNKSDEQVYKRAPRL